MNKAMTLAMLILAMLVFPRFGIAGTYTQKGMITDISSTPTGTTYTVTVTLDTNGDGEGDWSRTFVNVTQAQLDKLHFCKEHEHEVLLKYSNILGTGDLALDDIRDLAFGETSSTSSSSGGSYGVHHSGSLEEETSPDQ